MRGAATYLNAALDRAERLEPEGADVLVLTRPSPNRDGPNEDSCAVFTTGSGLVLACADGMGGHRGGAEASRLAIEAIAESLAGGGADGLRTAILNGFELANRRILDEGIGSGTTLAVAEITGGTVRSYHVGDSMVLVTGQRGRVRFQALPHSPVGYAVESGLLSEEEALVHAESHIVSNIVGSEEMRVDVGPPVKLNLRDTVLVASDGLGDNITRTDIVDTVRAGPLGRAMTSLQATCAERMSGTGPAPGKPDDLTILLYRQKTG